MNTYTIRDVDVMARTMYGEARGEPRAVLVAVAWVIRNRVEAETWYGKGVRGVCLKRWQFSCWNQNDPNKKVIEDVALPDPIFSECLIIAIQVLCGQIADPTHGANHYCTHHVTPDWSVGQYPVYDIGNHVFYRL